MNDNYNFSNRLQNYAVKYIIGQCGNAENMVQRYTIQLIQRKI
ncbi:hypothetical protein QTH79_10060 [Clostridium perfringens]|nr:hypothetical protein [Clostridium perfringens]